MEPTFYATYFRHEDTHWWFRWRYELISRIVGEVNGGEPENFRILDAGCGTGQMLQHLGGFGHAIGIDTSPEAIRFAATRNVEHLVLGSILELPFPENTFDCVLSLDVIEHVDADVELIRYLADVLKPGGHLVLTVPAFHALWSEHDEVNWHKRRYRAPQLREILTSHGLEIERLTYCNTALFAPIFAIRKLKNLRNRFRGGLVRRNGHPEGLPHFESDLGELPNLVNEGLYRLMQAENRVLARRDFPFGVSLLAIARKPGVPSIEGGASPHTVAAEPSARELVGV